MTGIDDTTPQETAELGAANFDEFFKALWDRPPFAWQRSLAARVLSHGDASSTPLLAADAPSDGRGTGQSSWPDAIALPTASGKTACMDIALFALAAQATRLGTGQAITAPRRVFFVVDRRIIVDEAYERARRIANKLARANTGILKKVKENLLCICHGGTERLEHERPLAVHSLRGGMYRSEGWARNPLQPTIVASTVDQIGSRLLFRAYGRGFGTWPIYAGLVGNDSLILLDEAHCSQPFLQTLQAVRKYRSWAHTPLERCFHPVVMSATPPPGLRDVFTDSSGEGIDPRHPLGRRQLARKPAKLCQVAKAKGARATEDELFSNELANAARQLLGEGRQAVVVFVNRVATARKTHRLLLDTETDIVLLTGRMRPADKDEIVTRLQEMCLQSARSEDRDLERPVIVVATQTLEVGADLDFDGLVTECASLDALRQRFGRLNRMGREVDSRAKILIRGDQVDPKEEDAIYGDALSKTWAWLDDNKDGNGEIDFGVAALDRLLPKDEALAELSGPAAAAPVMLPAHVDCWSQTAPEPRPSPDVAPFLHGPREGAADVQVCWRADLDLSSEAAQRDALDSLSLCPPSSVEMLPVPVTVFRRWLAGQEAADNTADVEGTYARDGGEPEEGSELGARLVICWRGRATRREDITASPSDIRPGDIVVVPVAHPGPPQQIGDLPLDAAEPAALDIGDMAHRIARAKPILRLHPSLVRAWPDSLTAKTKAESLLDSLEHNYEQDADKVAADVRDLLKILSSADATGRWAWLPRAAGELNAEFTTPGSLLRACRPIGGRSLILAGRRRVNVERFPNEADVFSDEDDVASSGNPHRDGKPVLLRTHLPGVQDFARGHAAGCSLPEDLREALARAGLLHDVGKADPRFQSLLRGGSHWATGEPLAKSAEMPGTRAALRRTRDASGYPEGGRHELLSVCMAERAPAMLPDDPDLRDLVLHLVASHHGHCRPFAPVVVDEEHSVTEFELNGHSLRWCGPTHLERLDSGVADRYWRLTRRYGWWGLAWLEALLRLADWRRSDWEETHDAE